MAAASNTRIVTAGTADARPADRRAGRHLSAATGIGALLGTAWQLAGAGRLPFLPQNWAGTQLMSFGAGILAAALLLAAWFLTARAETRQGIRVQRGAMAALAALAVLCIPFTPDLVFSPVFGGALILLALRTREALTAALGLTALAAAVVLAFCPSLTGAALIPALTAAAAVAVVVRLGSTRDEPRRDRAGYSPR
ncbi:hypothetical protein [Arthrobacter sp. zg-Y1143]|uniref:hypothetical protein n=1 Tax=Arthrobacter sp. zg-Y1143 TaxID=3049065 RepID=UPI0024C3A99E|nr:hypothetical protein [Arthrobacter sp. zg-Y1143]MDK1328730.1 hypothetical protein [Arthrobacter sp. zg-Y1143]